jgi:uncharacterized protein (DUF1778 family)
MKKPKENRTEALGLRITPTLRKALDRAAEEDGRTLAGFVEKVLTDRLREMGYLKR